MSDSGVCYDLLKRVERIEKRLNIEAELKDFCCVDEPPEEFLNVHISSPDYTDKLAAFYCGNDETWNVKASKSMGAPIVLELCRAAMQGVRWTHIREGE